MFAYLLVDFLIVILGLSLLNFSAEHQKNKKKYIYLIFAAIILVLFSAFRGNMTADYDNYVDLFYRYDGFSFKQILSRGLFDYPEEGYVLFQFFIRHTFKESIYLFLFTSIFIVFANLREIGKHCEIFLVLPILLFIDVGEYYNSFNLIRQVFAASIIILGSKHIYNRHFFKFALYVIIAALFHKTSIFMIPFYFLLNIKFCKKSVFLYLIVTTIFFIFLDKIIAFIQNYYWSWYTDDAYGMGGYNIKNIVMPCFISFVPICYYFFNSKNMTNEENVWANASCLYFTFALLGMKIFMTTRLMVFFSLYSILGFSLVISKIKNKDFRNIAYISILLLVIAYGYFSKNGTSYNPYFFI